MSREAHRANLLRFLQTIQRPDAPPIEEGADGSGGALDEHMSLVDSGLIDSLAVIQIVSYLEEAHGIDFRAAGLDPDNLRSIAGILDLIQLRQAG